MENYGNLMCRDIVPMHIKQKLPYLILKENLFNFAKIDMERILPISIISRYINIVVVAYFDPILLSLWLSSFSQVSE